MDAAVAAAVAEAHRQEWGYVLAATARITRDLDTAEECVQDAYAQALTAWSAGGVPRPAPRPRRRPCPSTQAGRYSLPGITGRSSTQPCGQGTALAITSASSRSAASNR